MEGALAGVYCRSWASDEVPCFVTHRMQELSIENTTELAAHNAAYLYRMMQHVEEFFLSHNKQRGGGEEESSTRKVHKPVLLTA